MGPSCCRLCLGDDDECGCVDGDEHDGDDVDGMEGWGLTVQVFLKLGQMKFQVVLKMIVEVHFLDRRSAIKQVFIIK